MKDKSSQNEEEALRRDIITLECDIRNRYEQYVKDKHVFQITFMVVALVGFSTFVYSMGTWFDTKQAPLLLPLVSFACFGWIFIALYSGAYYDRACGPYKYIRGCNDYLQRFLLEFDTNTKRLRTLDTFHHTITNEEENRKAGYMNHQHSL